MGCIINMEMVVAYAFVIGKNSPLPLNLVNKSVSRETSMPAVNWLTQIGNERMSVIDRHVLYAATLSGDCLLPALLQRTACLSVCFTLDCVQFSKTDCTSVRFNLDNGNKTSP